MPLTNGGANAVGFTTATPGQMVVITFNAECTAVGPSNFSWLSVEITVDQNPAAPVALGDFSLCSSQPVKTFNATSRQAVYVVPNAGIHLVRVEATPMAGATYWRLDDTTLTVMN